MSDPTQTSGAAQYSSRLLDDCSALLQTTTEGDPDWERPRQNSPPQGAIPSRELVSRELKARHLLVPHIASLWVKDPRVCGA
ncbi:hypothetical protein GCM10027090_26450 [Sinomonas soli]